MTLVGEKGKAYGLVKPALKPSIFGSTDDDDEDMNAVLREVHRKKMKQVLYNNLINKI